MRKVDSKEAYRIVMAGGEVAVSVSGWLALAVLRAGGEVTQWESNRTYFVIAHPGRMLSAVLLVRPADGTGNRIGNPTPKTLCSIDGFKNGYTVTKEPKCPTAAECNEHLARGGEVIGATTGLAPSRYFGKSAQIGHGHPFDSPHPFRFEGASTHLYLDVVTTLGQRSPWFGDAPVAEKSAVKKPVKKRERVKIDWNAVKLGDVIDEKLGKCLTTKSPKSDGAAYVDKLTAKERAYVEKIRTLYEPLKGTCFTSIIDRLAPPPPVAKPRRKCTLGEAVDAMMAKKVVYRDGVDARARGYNEAVLVAVHNEDVIYEIEE
jgi:hypothetical protein